MAWISEEYDVAMPYGPRPTRGFTCKGLGIHLITRASSKGRRPARWSLTHLGTGHRLCEVRGSMEHVQAIVGELADTGDWTFLSMQGYRDMFPDAPDQFHAWRDRHPEVKTSGGGPENLSAARQIASNRS